MKILIAYTSRHGAAEKCASMMAKIMKEHGEIKLIDLRSDDAGDLSEYDAAILGGSVYAFHTQSRLTEFCRKNIDALKDKPLGLFLCCLNNEDGNALSELAEASFGGLYSYADSFSAPGGELNYNRMTLIEKLIIAAIAHAAKKSGKPMPPRNEENIISTISEDSIAAFCQRLIERM